MSIGVAAYPESALDSDGVLGAADAALLRAKSRGRNRVCLHADGETGFAAELEGDLVALGRRFAAFIGLDEAETAGLVTALAVQETGGAVQDEVQSGPRQRQERRRQAQRGAPERRGRPRVRQRALGRQRLSRGPARERRSRAWPAPSPSAAATTSRRTTATAVEDLRGVAAQGARPAPWCSASRRCSGRTRPSTTRRASPAATGRPRPCPSPSRRRTPGTTPSPTCHTRRMDNVRPIRPRSPRRSRAASTRARRIVLAIIIAVVVVLLVAGSRLLGLLRRLALVRRGRLPLGVLDAHPAGRCSSGSSAFARLLRHRLPQRASSRGAWRRPTASPSRRPARAAQRVRAQLRGLGRRGRLRRRRPLRRHLGVHPVADLPPVLQAGAVRPEGRHLRPRHRLLRLLAADVAGGAELRARRPRRRARVRRHRAPHHGRHRLQRQGAGRAGAAPAETRARAGPSNSPFARAQRAGAPQIPQIDIKLGGRAVAHLSGILAAIFVVVGVGQLFRGWSLLYSTAGAIYGAGYTDVHIRLPLTYVAHGDRASCSPPCSSGTSGGGTSGGPSRSPSWIVVLIVLQRHRPGDLPVGDRQPEPAHQGAQVHRLQPGGDQGGLRPQPDHAAAAESQDAPDAAEARREPGDPEQHPPLGPRRRWSPTTSSSRNSSPTTRSSTPTSTATRSTASTRRRCSRPASSTSPGCRRRRRAGSTSTSPTRTASASRCRPSTRSPRTAPRTSSSRTSRR